MFKKYQLFQKEEEFLPSVIKKNVQKNAKFNKKFKNLKKQFFKHGVFKDYDKLSRKEFIKLLEIAKIDVPSVRDKYFEEEFDDNHKCSNKLCGCFKRILKKIRRQMVKKYIETLKNPET